MWDRYQASIVKCIFEMTLYYMDPLHELGREVYPGGKHKKSNQWHLWCDSHPKKNILGGVYCASKHAADALTRSLRMELISTNINVTGMSYPRDTATRLD